MQHAPTWNPRPWEPPQTRPDRRASAARRGYDRRWRAFRKRYLDLHPYCLDCHAAGTRTFATEIHHLVKAATSPHLFYDTRNLRPLCATCHRRRTLAGE